MARKAVLTSRQKAMIRTYQRLLLKAGIAVERIILFGSHAKGTAHKWSDLDLCVVSTQFGKHPFEEGVKLMTIRTDDLLDIEPHPFNPEDLKDKYDSLAAEIRKYGIRVV